MLRLLRTRCGLLGSGCLSTILTGPVPAVLQSAWAVSSQRPSSHVPCIVLTGIWRGMAHPVCVCTDLGCGLVRFVHDLSNDSRVQETLLVQKQGERQCELSDRICPEKVDTQESLFSFGACGRGWVVFLMQPRRQKQLLQFILSLPSTPPLLLPSLLRPQESVSLRWRREHSACS